MKTKTGTVKVAKKFSKEITCINAFAIIFKDEHGQVIYTFDSKKKADEFYKVLIKQNEKRDK